MTDEKPPEAGEEPVQVDEAVEAEAPAEVAAEAPPPPADSGADEGMDPAVEEHIAQDGTVLHEEPEGDGSVPTEFRTPPGIPSGLDPGTAIDRGND